MPLRGDMSTCSLNMSKLRLHVDVSETNVDTFDRSHERVDSRRKDRHGF